MINHDLLDSWADSFIPHDLEKFIVHSENDYDEHEGYAADIDVDNYENDLQAALDDQICDSIQSDCVYHDVEFKHQTLTLDIISAILNLEKNHFQRETSVFSTDDRSDSAYVENIAVI